MLTRLKSSSLALVVIGSMPMVICNRFHKRLANKEKWRFLWEYHSLMPSCIGFLEPRKSRLRPSKSTFNAESFVCSLSLCISIDFSAIRSWNVSCSPELPKYPKKPCFGVQNYPRSLISVPIESQCTTSY